MPIYPFDTEHATGYVQALWPGGLPEHTQAVLFALPERSVWSYHDSEVILRALPNIYGSADMYIHMGVVSDSKKYARNTRPTISDILYIPAVWVDLDPKGISKEELRGWLDGLAFTPSMLVDTGNGYHAYWLLDKPLYAAAAGPLVHGFQNWIQGQAHFHIDSTFDLARVMRIPGTWNYKDPQNPKRVELVYANTSRRYDRSEFPIVEVQDVPVTTRVLPDVIPEGGLLDSSGRDDTLFKMLCALRRFGCTEGMLMTVATAINEKHMEPPLADRVVKRKVYSAMKYKPTTLVETELERIMNERALRDYI